MSKCHDCNPALGGTPLCKLAVISDPQGNNYAKSVHIKGASAFEVQQRQRSNTLTDQEYDTLIIADSPGAIDDVRNLPFQSEAGDILIEFLEKAGFDLHRTFITYLVKCRTPKNRRPAAAEIKACNQHLEYELKQLNPKVVMLLGTPTLKLFNLHNAGGIGKNHGQIFKLGLPAWEDEEHNPTFKVIPSYNPTTFAIRPNAKLQRRIMADYVVAAQSVHDDVVETPFYKADYKLVKTIEDVKDMCDQIKEAKLFAWDTESPDSFFMRSPMITAQFSLGKGRNWVVPHYTHDPNGDPFKLKPYWSNADRDIVNALLTEIFEDETIAKTAHFIKYDINVIRRWVGAEVKGWLWDTLVLHRLLDEYPPHKLEHLADMEFASGDYSIHVREIVGHGKNLIKTYDNIPDHILHPYGATDAELTYRLLEIYHPQMVKRSHLLKFYSEETQPALHSFAEAEWNGHYIDTDTAKILDKQYEEEIEELLQLCRAETKPDFNPSSPDQVAKALVELGHANLIEAPTKAKGYSTAKDILLDIEDKVPLAGYIIKYRNRRKMKSTYTETAIEELDADNRIRFPFNIPGTTSLRASARFNHQIPKIIMDLIDAGKVVMRDMFAEEEGFVYFYGDFSQIELRVFAVQTKDEDLLKFLPSGGITGDIHKQTAADALSIRFDQVSQYNRDAIGKPLNFGVIFGSEGHSLAKLDFENIRTGKKEIIGFKRALHFVDAFKEAHPKVKEFLNYIPDLARSQGCRLQSVFGGERYIPDLNSTDKYVRLHAEREATNFVVQSPAGGITIRTINMMREVLRQNKVDNNQIRFVNSVHDSVAYGVRADLVDWFDRAFRIVATREIKELNNYSFPIKTGWGKTWARAEIAAK